MAKPVFKATKSKTESSFIVRRKQGSYIFKEGDLGIEMYVIQDGQVEILKRHQDSERRLAVLAQGDFFGEMSILEDLPRSASARALRDCKLLEINATTFDQMLRKNPEIAVRMMRKLSRRLRQTDQMLRDVLGSDESLAPEMPAAMERTRAVGREKLVHEISGHELFLSAGEQTSIGRRDPVTGINPDVDLTPIDAKRSISRRHATILRRGGKFYVREEIGTMNGTFVNGQRIETGELVEFQEGDEVSFGLVKTVFRRS